MSIRLQKRARATFLAFAGLLLAGALLTALGQETPPRTRDASPSPTPSRDVIRTDIAGNPEVERILKSFVGRGELGDGSPPTPAAQAVRQFEVADGLKIELVAAEPSLEGTGEVASSAANVPPVEQPLFLHFDERGRLWVVQYRQYPFPEGLKVIRYDQHLRAVFDKVPLPPPHHVPGRDKVTVYEDTDGDGTYETHRDVITGLNIATAVVTGRGPSSEVGGQRSEVGGQRSGVRDQESEVRDQGSEVRGRRSATFSRDSTEERSGAGQKSEVRGQGAGDSGQGAVQAFGLRRVGVSNEQPPYGLYVLNPPYLLFYPDANRDDVPDGDPVVCLSGFGLEDTHSVANSLRWGPDGWLYGANGSTTTGDVSSAVTKNVRWEGQNIWRFHPETHVFEIFAEGGGNTFSSEIDSQGRVFSGTNHGNTRGMYYPQGSYGEKNWGKHGPLTNPFAFGYFDHMRHEGDKDRFPQKFVIYEGGALPRTYHGDVIAANALHNRVWASELLNDTSTYRTVDLPPLVTTPDRWFRPVCLEVGPDGAVYLADWYDTRLSHNDPRDNWHKTSGRIYRLVSAEGVSVREASGELSKSAERDFPWRPTDLMAMSDDELIALFAHPNKWWRQTASRVLGDRLKYSLRQAPFPHPDSSFRTAPSPTFGAKSQAPKLTLSRLIEIALDGQDGRALEALWTIHAAGRFDFELASRLLTHPNEHVRRWTVRLLGDHRRLNDDLGRQLAALAKTEPYVQVRTQLASSAKRFDTPYALPIIRELLQRDEDLTDRHQPLLLWWALESHCGFHRDPHLGVPLPDAQSPEESRAAVLAMFADPDLWNVPIVKDVILSRLMQRFALDEEAAPASGTSGLEVCARLLELAPSDEHSQLLMSGFLAAYQGREIGALPPSLADALDEYQRRLGASDVALALRRGSDEAVERALKVIGDEAADVAERLAYIEILGEINKPRVVKPLLSLLSSRHAAVKRAAMQALMNYDDPRIGETICQRYQTTLPAEHDLRSTAHRVLASRPMWTKQFLAEITSHRIKRQTIPLDIVQQMRLHDDPQIQATLDELWGRTRSTPEEKWRQIERVRALIVSGRYAGSGTGTTSDGPSADSPSRSPNPHRGRELFAKHCGTCHTLFDEGGQAGPNLTGYERTNLDFLLPAVIDPSAAIREEYTQYQVVTIDGRVLTGLIDAQTPTTVTLRGVNNQTTLVNRDDIELLQAMETSLMPDGLMEQLSDDDVRDLFAYLTARTRPQ